VKSLYYNFKKNNLTDDGLNEWNETLQSIRHDTSIDPERDFVDLIGGNLAFALFSKKGMSPEGAMIAEIDDSSKMIDTMKRIIQSLKDSESKMYQEMATMYGGTPSGIQQDRLKTSINRGNSGMEKKYRDLAENIRASEISEKSLPEGKIYSYALPSMEDKLAPSMLPTINFSLEDGQFILGTDFEITEALTKELKIALRKNWPIASSIKKHRYTIILPVHILIHT
jgi:hypothetical protein